MNELITVAFREDTLFAIKQDDGNFLALKPICDRMGLAWAPQRERINRDPILAKGSRMARLPSIGGMQETLCLDILLVHGWLFTIETSRIKNPETREIVLAYQRECFTVLHDHFYSKRKGPKPEVSDAAKWKRVAEIRRTFGARMAAKFYIQSGLPTLPEMFYPPAQGELIIDETPRAPADVVN